MSGEMNASEISSECDLKPKDFMHAGPDEAFEDTLEDIPEATLKQRNTRKK
jgi:hypothetical protein